MSQGNSFSTFDDDDKTIIRRPSPGGRKPESSVVPPTPPRTAPWLPVDLLTDGATSTGPNPLIANMSPLLSLVLRLRHLPAHGAVDDLQERLVGEIRAYEHRTLQQTASKEEVERASYFLCSLIDETVLNTPWGSRSTWGHQSLLSRLHGDTWGGENFFSLLDQARQHPSQNRRLLELAYLCLSLGFEGKYRLQESGIRDLEQLRQELYVFIQSTRGDVEPALSPHWQGLHDSRSPIAQHVPLWVFAVVVSALLVVAYLGFAWSINNASDRVSHQLLDIANKQPMIEVIASHAPVVPSGPPWYEPFQVALADEIAANKVEIVIDDYRLRITNAFASGSYEIKREYQPMLDKIAQILQAGTARIEVVGHTDLRGTAQSNLTLSEQRAKNVADILRRAAPLGKRLSYSGRGESEPIDPKADNRSAENRARNRRIEIIVYPVR